MIRYLSQAIAYSLFVAVVAVFSIWPEYRLLEEQQAIVSLTFSHAPERIEECRRLTQEELNELPPNMRKPDDCPRERHPLRIEMRIENAIVFSETLLPSGLWRDGKSNVYQRNKIDAGDHALFIGMNDSGSDEGFDYEHQSTITILPGQNLVIRFDDSQKAFVID